MGDVLVRLRRLAAERTSVRGIAEVVQRLRLRASFDLRPLDERSLAATAPRGRRPDCPRCAEKCCRAPHRVRLRLEDVARLLDAGLDHAVEPSPDAAEPPRLRHRDGACVFLDSNERCSIYELRPISCRAYPYQVSEARDRVRYAGACPSWIDDPNDATEDLVKLALHAYEARRKDVILLETRRGELEELGVLGPFESNRPDFETVLERKKKG